MPGPTTGSPSLPDVQVDAAAGAYETGDIVWVVDIQKYVRIFPLNAGGHFAVPIRYADPNDFQTDVDTFDWPDFTPSTVDYDGTAPPDLVIVNAGCTGVTQYSVLEANALVTSYNLNGFDPRVPARREEGSGMTFDFDSADVANTAEMDDPPP